MKTFDRIIIWVIVQLVVIALLYNLGLIPSHIVLDRLVWGGTSGFKWALSYAIYFVPYCLLICLIYTIVGVLVTKKVPIHSKRWRILAESCYVAFLIITGLGFYLVTEYAFYDSYGAAVIDVWLAPLLWLGEVEVYLWINERFKVYPVARKIGFGLQKGIKWILIQYLVAALIFLCLLVTGLLDKMYPEEKEDIFSYALMGFLMSIFVYTLLFAWWHSFLQDRKYWWTYCGPWIFVMILGVVVVLVSDNVAFKDADVRFAYMLGIGLAPVFGTILHFSMLSMFYKPPKMQEIQSIR